MTTKKINQLNVRIEKIRKDLSQIGEMRPGSISKQYRDPKKRKGSYYQLSYTHNMQSRTEHVWPEHVQLLGKEIATYRKFKRLTKELIDLSIERSRANIAYLREHSDS